MIASSSVSSVSDSPGRESKNGQKKSKEIKLEAGGGGGRADRKNLQKEKPT